MPAAPPVRRPFRAGTHGSRAVGACSRLRPPALFAAARRPRPRRHETRIRRRRCLPFFASGLSITLPCVCADVRTSKHMCVSTETHSRTHRHTYVMCVWDDVHCIAGMFCVQMYTHTCTRMQTHTRTYTDTRYMRALAGASRGPRSKQKPNRSSLGLSLDAVSEGAYPAPVTVLSARPSGK